MAAAYPAAWFILASSNQDTFINAVTDDLLIYPTGSNSSYGASGQSLLLGVPSSNASSGVRLTASTAEVLTPLSAPSLLIASSNTSATIRLDPRGVVVADNVVITSDGTLNNGVITPLQLQDQCVTTDKLRDANITTDKIADGAITSAKLKVEGAVALDGMKVSSTAVDSNGTISLGYSNYDATTYALSQTTSSVTSINSGPGTTLSMCVGGTQLATLNPDGDLSVLGGFTQTSDRNLKTDLQRVEGGLAKLLQLNGYTFRMRGRPVGSDQSAGLIAQEVQAVLPQAVRVSSISQALSLDYSAMSGLYVEAIKDLHAMVQELQAQVQQLQSAQSQS